jgi:polar amino acid transport system permease protein
MQDLAFLFYYLLAGLGVTIGVTIIALSFGFVLGMGLALLRVYGGRLAAGLAQLYSTVMRALPVVLVIFILYFGISQLIDLTPFLSGALALGFASTAYQSEIFRGAIQSVPGGQMIAARAIGMSRGKAIRYVVLPQAIRLAIPAWSNEAATILKDSSLVYVIGVPEILRRAEYVSARTLEPFVAFGAAALIYFCLTFIANRFLDTMERRYKLLT